MKKTTQLGVMPAAHEDAVLVYAVAADDGGDGDSSNGDGFSPISDHCQQQDLHLHLHHHHHHYHTHHEELVIGRRLPAQYRFQTAQDEMHRDFNFSPSSDSAYSMSSPGPYPHAGPRVPCPLGLSESDSSELMRMTAYESMLASQQWIQQRARTHASMHQSALRIPTHRVLTTWGLLAISYFVCCGGPVGTEPLVSSGGPLLGLVAQIGFPLVFNLPILLAITELATAYPNDGGYAVWVLNAFGPFWGFQVGFWSWVASIIDRVVYLQFLYDQLAGPLGYADAIDTNGDSVRYFSYGVEYAIKAGVSVLLCLPTIFCTKTFVRALYVQLLLVLVPVVILSVWGFTKTDSLSQFGDTRPDKVADAEHFDGLWKFDWSTYLGIFWYYDGFYLAAVFGGEVAKPQKTYPQGIKWGFLLTWLSYLLPMLAVIGVAGSSSSQLHWSLFEEDAYPEIAKEFGGQTLYMVMLIGLVTGVTGMYMVEIFCQAYQMRGMAENDLIPSIFMKRHRRFGSPRKSIYFSVLVVLAALTLDLADIYEVKDALSGLVELFIIFAAVRLRQTQPFVSRSFKMPGGLFGMAAILILPTLMLCYQVGNQFRVAQNAVVLGGTVLVGFVISVTSVWYRTTQRKKSARMMMEAATMMLSADDVNETVFIR